VFELDMNDYSITQQAVIFIERDGKSYNDLNAHIIRYDNGNRRIFIATWGNDFGGEIKILHKLITSGDILSGVSLISGLTELSLPGLETEDYGAYDPFALYDGDQWLIAYTITEDTNFTDNPFYPALASSEDLSSFDLIGADEDMSGIGYEGTRIIKTNNSYWILAGGPAGSADNARIYDIEMNYRGDLDAVFDGGSVTLPHPMIFAYLDNFYLLTFDDTRYLSLAWTWGQPWIEISNRYQWASGNFFLLF